MAALDFFYPFDSVSGDRKTTAATERRFFNDLFTSGVVGHGAFAVNETAAGTYSIGAGTAIIGGAIGGLVNARSVTAKPAQGARLYIALRLDTTTAVRTVSLETVSSLSTATQAQLDQGGILDLPLYSVEGYAGGTYGLLDLRTYCTSFDNAEFTDQFNAMVAALVAGGQSEIDAVVEQFEQAIIAADTETAGLYGAAGRQGFMNPAFLVDQRGGAPYSLSSGTTYTFDRWQARIGGASTSSAVTVNRVQDGARSAMTVVNRTFSGTGAAATCVAQNIEGGMRTFAAGNRAFTVSFDAKANVAVNLAVEPTQVLETGTTGVALPAQVVAVTTSWQRFSLTFTGTATPTAAQANDVLRIAFFTGWRGYADRFGADQNREYTLSLARVQLNEGTAALPCYIRPYGDELEACRRYFVRYGFTSLAVSGQNASTRHIITSPVPLTRAMRTAPTISFTDRNGATGVASVETVAGQWRNSLPCDVSTSSRDFPVLIVTNSDTAAVTRVCFNSIALDAELHD